MDYRRLCEKREGGVKVMNIERKHGHEGFIITVPNEYPTAEEVEAWLNLIEVMGKNAFYILGKDSKLEILGCLNCDLRDWLRQKQWYYGW